MRVATAAATSRAVHDTGFALYFRATANLLTSVDLSTHGYGHFLSLSQIFTSYPTGRNHEPHQPRRPQRLPRSSGAGKAEAPGAHVFPSGNARVGGRKGH